MVQTVLKAYAKVKGATPTVTAYGDVNNVRVQAAKSMDVDKDMK